MKQFSNTFGIEVIKGQGGELQTYCTVKKKLSLWSSQLCHNYGQVSRGPSTNDVMLFLADF